MRFLQTFILIALTVLALLSGSCSEQPAPTSPSITTSTTPNPSASFQNINVSQAFEMMQKNKENPNFVILDVRTPDEYNSGHIANSILIDYQAPDFKENISKLEKDKQYMVYCRSGRRSAEASQIMIEIGFNKVYNVTAGINDWISQGYPVVK